MKRMIMILENYEKIDENEVKYGERIDHWLDGVIDGNDPKLNNDDDIKRIMI